MVPSVVENLMLLIMRIEVAFSRILEHRVHSDSEFASIHKLFIDSDVFGVDTGIMPSC